MIGPAAGAAGILLPVNQRKYPVESQQNGQISQAEHKKFDPERKNRSEPSSAKITEKQKPQRCLNAHAERAPRLGPELLIPYAPEGKRQAAGIAESQIADPLRKDQQREQAHRKI